MSVLQDEIFQQPDAVGRFLDQQGGNTAQIARALSSRTFDFIFIAARGTSDNAARYGQYLFGTLNRLPVALAAPSLFTVYGAPPRLERALVIGISQSGQSPDVVQVVEEARHQGAPTIAITNDPSSPMASAAEFHIDLSVGKEQSVAATKTYTAQLAALALLALQMGGLSENLSQLQQTPRFLEQALAAEPQTEAAARSLARFDRSVVIGRGFNYSTAFETALKIKELSYVNAEAYSSADFMHGPIALAEAGLPVLVVSCGPAFKDELAELRRELGPRGARLVTLSDTPVSDPQPEERTIALPQEMPEWLSPIVSVVPGQLLAYHLSFARGFDPDQPRTIRKVTKTY